MWPSDFFDKLKSKTATAPVPENGTPDVRRPLACWLSADGEPFVSIMVPKPRPHTEHWPLDAGRTKSLVRDRISRLTDKNPSRTMVDQRLDELRTEAECSGKVREVYVRAARIDDALYLDFGDPDWRTIEVTKTGWRILDRSPVPFRRSQTTKPFPEPVAGGKIDLLRPFLNLVSNDDFRLVCAWLTAVLAGVSPYPLLVLTGEAGSAKTTNAKILVGLVDPRSPTTRALPQSIRDLMVAFDGALLIAYDNVSIIRPWLADALCRLATGAGFGVRRHYSNRDEVVFSASRPVLLNGIPDLLWRSDLADRSIRVILPAIPDNKRRPVSELGRDLDAAMPQIFGALLDIIVAGLQRIDTVHPAALPRMADFAKWGIAIERELGWSEGAFLATYDANHSAIISDALEGNAVAAAVIKFASKRAPWEGTATELREALKEDTPIGEWNRLPKSPSWLSGDLRRLVGPLRLQGIEIVFDENRKSGARLIKIRKVSDANDDRCRSAA